MKIRLRALLLTLALAWTHLPCNAQGDPFGEVIKCESTSADLVNTLAQVAWLSHLPMIAELAQPLPRIEIAEGTYVTKDLLQEIARQAPDYEWEAEGKVVHFYNRKLSAAKFNFLNLRLPRFAMPSNLSEFKLTFPEREFALLQGYSGGGLVTIGVGDSMLEKDLLRAATLENVTGREILLRAANESPAFFAMIVFPNADPTGEQVQQDMNRNWFWQSFKEQRLRPLYVQPPATTRR
jgi:hypothetical protein